MEDVVSTMLICSISVAFIISFIIKVDEKIDK